MPYNCFHDQCTGTHNCTFTSKRRAFRINFLQIANGMNGVEDRIGWPLFGRGESILG